jgi:hypothetical protein
MPRNICLAFTCFGSLFFTHLFGECRWGCLFIHLLSGCLFIQQPGNTHGIYHNGQITPTEPFVHSALSPVSPP